MIEFGWKEDGMNRNFEIPVSSVYSVVIDYLGQCHILLPDFTLRAPFWVTEGRDGTMEDILYRSKVAQYENQSLIKIEGVNTAKDAEFYFGKRVAYVYKVYCCWQ